MFVLRYFEEYSSTSRNHYEHTINKETSLEMKEGENMFKILNLRTDYLIKMGIDAVQPKLSWNIESDMNDSMQQKGET